MISYVIPAHNEEGELPRTLAALAATAREVASRFPADDPQGRGNYEILVVDDASTDRTAELAQEGGATVVPVRKRQIAAVRNAGAAAARGNILFFIDADTRVNAAAIRESLAALEAGAAGGGCHFGYDGPIRWWGRLLFPLFLTFARWRRVAGGCCLFARRDAFEAAGGFDERVYAAEDIAFCQALGRQGRFVIPRARVLTSSRKLDTVSFAETMRLVARLAWGGPRAFSSREGLDLWYRQREVRPQPGAEAEPESSA